MRRAAIPIFLAALGLFIANRSVDGQPAQKIIRIAVLTSAWSPWNPITDGFRKGLADLGFVEGREVLYDTIAVEGHLERLPKACADLVKGNPDLIVSGGPSEVASCKKATSTIPIVFVNVGDPVNLGLVRTLAHPGGNITGIATMRDELTAKRIELFKTLVPTLRRILICYDPRVPEEQAAVASARIAVRRLGLKLLAQPIMAPLEVDEPLKALESGGEDGILLVQSNTNNDIETRSLEVATDRQLPTMYAHSQWPGWGALASYGPNPSLQGQQAARQAAQILKGASPADIPVELPDRIEFVVNLKTAKNLGLPVPGSVLILVDRLIQ
jgi:putative ABC transport system substrate-binding protein